MDYFSELLESYSKLKKRTFKLTYISEEEGAQTSQGQALAQQYADDAIANAPVGDESAAAPVMKGEEDSGLLIYKKADNDVHKKQRSVGNVMVKGLPMQAGKGGAFIVVQAGPVNPPGDPRGPGVRQSFLKSAPKGYEKFVEYLGSDTKKPTDTDRTAADIEAQKAAEEAARKQKLEEIGGWSELNGVTLTAETIASLNRSKEIADDYCKQIGDAQPFEGFCARIKYYFAAGTQNIGLEYKLASAGGIAVTDRETGQTRKVKKLSPATIEQAAKSAELLISFLKSSNEEKCEQLKKRVGFFKGKQLVLFGDQNPTNQQEAIVVGKPNALQKLALEKIALPVDKGGCGIDPKLDLSSLVGDSISTSEKNAVKGTFFEEIVKFAGNFAAAKTPKQKMAAAQALKEVLKDKKATLIAIAQEGNQDAGATLDQAFTNFVQSQVLSVLGNPAKLSRYLLNELKAIQPVIKFMGADEIIHGGKSSLTGQRADIFFAYNDEATAKAKAEQVGSSVVEKDGKFVIAAGLKRLEEMHGPKLGEINSQERLDGIATGQVQDRFIAAGFHKSMNLRQFKKNTGKSPREKAMNSYASGLSTAVTEATDQLASSVLYITGDKKLKSQKPSDVLSLLARTVLEKLKPKDLKRSLIAKALFDIDTEGNAVRKNFDGDSPGASENRQRAREMISRAVRMRKLRDDIESGNQAARDYAIRLALVTGSNKGNMSQIIVDDEGELVMLRHNKIFDLICEAENSKDPNKKPKITFSESGYSITVETDKGPLTVKVGQEMSKVTDKDDNFVSCDTRTDCKLPTSTVLNEELHGDISDPKNESTLHKFLAGQMKLLEEILNSSKENPLL